MGTQGQFRPPLERVVTTRDAFTSMRPPLLHVEYRLVEREVSIRHSGERFIGCRTMHNLVRLATV